MTKKKATEDQFNELHNLVTKEFLARIKSGEASTADLKAEYDSSQLQIKKRARLNKENRRRGTYGNGDGKDVAHSRSGKTRLQAQSKNRASNGHGKRSRYS